MRTGKFLSAVLMSAAAGAALGILFAPNKGTDTRKKIRRQSDDLKEKLNDMVDEMAGKYEDAMAKSKKVKKSIS